MDAATPTQLFAETITAHGWEAYCAAARLGSAKPLSLAQPDQAKTILTQQKAKDAQRNS